MEQMQNLVDTFTLNRHDILNSVDIILIPFEFETLFTSHQLEVHLTLLLRLKHLRVEQVIDFFIIQL